VQEPTTRVFICALASLLAAGYARSEPRKLETVPYAAVDAEMRKAVLLAAEGKYAKAAAAAGKALSVPGHSRQFLIARLKKQAGDAKGYEREIERAASGGSVLAPIAALELATHRLAGAKGDKGRLRFVLKHADATIELLDRAREASWLAPAALSSVAEIREMQKEYAAAVEAIEAALAATPEGAAASDGGERDDLLVRYVRLLEKRREASQTARAAVGEKDPAGQQVAPESMDDGRRFVPGEAGGATGYSERSRGGDVRREREVLVDLFLYSHEHAEAALERLAEMLTSRELSILKLLRLVQADDTAAWAKEAARLSKRKKKTQWQKYTELVQRGALERSQRKREDALARFDAAESAAATPAEVSLARYLKGRTLEGLDRDLEARDVYARILADDPGFPLSHSLLVRLATLSVREGLPFQGMAYLEQFFSAAYPGESLCDALWLSGFLSYMSQDYPAAMEKWQRLATDCFYVERSPYERFGTMAMFWHARANLLHGNRNAALSTLRMLASGAGDYYSVLARERLEELGQPIGEWAPARLEWSPAGAPAEVEVDEALTAGVELFRLGLWSDAFDALRLAAPGVDAGGDAVALAASAWVRARGVTDVGQLRKQAGTLPAPWAGGARLWRRLFLLAFAGPLADACAASGLNPALGAAIVRFESGYNPRVVSRADAIGLFQVKTNTGTDVSVNCLKGTAVRARQLKEPELNLKLGAIYVAGLLARHHGNWGVSLAAYNAGPGTASWWLSRFSGLDGDELLEQVTYPNTVGYLKRIIGVVPIYWSLFYPVLGVGAPDVCLSSAIPQDLRPFFGEPSGFCPVSLPSAPGASAPAGDSERGAK